MGGLDQIWDCANNFFIENYFCDCACVFFPLLLNTLLLQFETLQREIKSGGCETAGSHSWKGPRVLGTAGSFARKYANPNKGGRQECEIIASL